MQAENTDKTVRLGTIGSGVIVHSVLKGVVKAPGFRLAAVYSRSADKAAALAGEFSGPAAGDDAPAACYTDMEAFLSDESVDLVYIATPNLLHYEQAKAALLHGKHVLCEKPMCTREDQAAELFALAESKGLLLMEAAPTSYLPNFRLLQEALPQIGRIRLVMGNYSQYSSRYDRLLDGEVTNIFEPDYAGGAFMDINLYNVLLNCCLFGRPESAKLYPNLFALPAKADRVSPSASIDTSGVLIMEYPGFVSTNAGAKDTFGINYFEIEGEKGYIYIKDGPNGIASVRVVTKESDVTLNEQTKPGYDRWDYEAAEVARIINEDDRAAVLEKKQYTLDTIHVMENARKAEGILFPGDTD